jgi:hypothetical protein
MRIPSLSQCPLSSSFRDDYYHFQWENDENGTDLFLHPQAINLIISQPGILPDFII